MSERWLSRISDCRANVFVYYILVYYILIHKYIHTKTYTYIYIYMYIYTCVMTFENLRQICWMQNICVYICIYIDFYILQQDNWRLNIHATLQKLHSQKDSLCQKESRNTIWEFLLTFWNSLFERLYQKVSRNSQILKIIFLIAKCIFIEWAV